MIKPKEFYMKKYYFKEKFFKITDKYWIMDENNDKAFYLDQDFTFLATGQGYLIGI